MQVHEREVISQSGIIDAAETPSNWPELRSKRGIRWRVDTNEIMDENTAGLNGRFKQGQATQS